MSEQGASREKGWYLYGLIDIQPPTPTLSGLDHVQCLRFRNITALVGEVSLDEFDESQLKERLNDPKWLEQKLWAHERVLDKALGMATVIPMKLATIFKSEQNLLAALETHDEGIQELFKKLKGRHEYGLKVFWERRLAQADVEQHEPRVQALTAQLAGQPEGTAYLLRKKLERVMKEEVEKRLGQHLQTIYERLGSVVEERRLNLVSPEQVIQRQAEVVLNAALLVTIERRAELLQNVSNLKEEFAPRGHSFRLTGPFPPYHFSQLTGFSAQSDPERAGAIG